MASRLHLDPPSSASSDSGSAEDVCADQVVTDEGDDDEGVPPSPTRPPWSPTAKNSPRARRQRHQSTSGTKKHDPVIRTHQRTIYTAGRPPWYDSQGSQQIEPFIIGISGGSASGKTTVARKIIEALDVNWVTLLSMDSFYKVLNEKQHHLAAQNEYNFDHPDAFDFALLVDTLRKLKEGKSVEVPIYNFTTHSRETRMKTMYGANVIIFEGILAFYQKEILELMDMKVFVDTDSDIRLARRLKRDITDRGRDLEGVLNQYDRFVKPAFEYYIAPSMVHADLIVPRGGENEVAISLIVQHVHSQLQLAITHVEHYLGNRAYVCGLGNPSPVGMTNAAIKIMRGFKLREKLVQCHVGQPLPTSLCMLPTTPQIQGLHTFIRNKDTPRDEFIFYSKRLMRFLIEFALSLLPFRNVLVETPQGVSYEGKRIDTQKICGVSILRAGETMEQALCDILKDVRIGKILIQTNNDTGEPELYYLRLPKDIKDYRVILMDATVATGAAAMMAIRVLLDHDVPEENIQLCSLLMAETGVHSVAYAFPKVKLVTTAVDPEINSSFYILPGIGNFGDRYFGTEANDD